MNDYKNSLLYKKLTNWIDPSKELIIEKLFSSVQLKEYSKGDIILEAGRICKSIFFIESGYIRIFYE